MRTSCVEVQQRIEKEFFILLTERLSAAFGKAMTPDSRHLQGCTECMARYSAKMEENREPYHYAFGKVIDRVVFGAHS